MRSSGATKSAAERKSSQPGFHGPRAFKRQKPQHFDVRVGAEYQGAVAMSNAIGILVSGSGRDSLLAGLPCADQAQFRPARCRRGDYGMPKEVSYPECLLWRQCAALR